jgi:DNA-binding PadR family transcriptional regulator
MEDATKGPRQGFGKRRAGGGPWAWGPGDEPGFARRRHGFKGPWGMGGPGLGFPWGGPGRPRPRRGDVRLAVLTLLAEQPMHGYQIITELAERSGGTWRPSPGSIYPTLQQLEDEGLVTATRQDGRRTYALTDAGRAEVERTSAGRRAPWEEFDDGGFDGVRNMRWAVVQLVRAAMQVAATGDEGQMSRAERILHDARKAVYRLLAEEDADEETEA